MRADARRNRNAVLEAGARLLAERPTASMQDIADASGVGRTTVYRHFPAREDLVAALIDQVAEEALQVMERATAADGTAPDVLRRLDHDIVALGRRWSFLRAQRDAVRAAAQDGDRIFSAWVGDAQRHGRIRTDQDADWASAVTLGILHAASAGGERRGVEEAARRAGDTRVGALVPA